MSANDSAFTVLGIDLAWGHKMPDAIAPITYEDGVIQVGAVYYTHGIAELREVISLHTADRMILAVDAPTICKNATGSRPVDKLCNQRFRQYEAGCHPVNLGLCSRPIEVAAALQQEGCRLSADLRHARVAMEVYPHPTMVRWFGLERTIKYKRGKVAEKRLAFADYQQRFRGWIAHHYSALIMAPDLERCLSLPWSKAVEDQLDAYFCAFIGLHYALAPTEFCVLGDEETGLMVVPV